MYFSANRADWVRENGNCLEVDRFKEIQRVLDWVMADIYEAALRGDTEIESYCPDKYSRETEDKLRDLGYEAEYQGGSEVMWIEW